MEEQTNKKRISLSQKVCDFIDSLCLSNQEREEEADRREWNSPDTPFLQHKVILGDGGYHRCFWIYGRQKRGVTPPFYQTS